MGGIRECTLADEKPRLRPLGFAWVLPGIALGSSFENSLKIEQNPAF